MEVYRYCGQTLKTDPRREKTYIDQVVQECKFDERTDLLPADRKVIEEVIRRKAAAFWIEDSPRTTLRHLYHDTIPTGPPVRSPPHHLKGEEAEFVDTTLQGEQVSSLANG